jgi:hypothetical protein
MAWWAWFIFPLFLEFGSTFFLFSFVSLVLFNLLVKLKCCLIWGVFWCFYRFDSLFSCADYAWFIVLFVKYGSVFLLHLVFSFVNFASVSLSVADTDPGYGAFLTPGSGIRDG